MQNVTLKDKKMALPYWLRGALIGVVIVLILFILEKMNFSFDKDGWGSLAGWIAVPFVLPTILFMRLCRLNQYVPNGVFWNLAFVTCHFFVYGAIVGAIVGKIKKKK